MQSTLLIKDLSARRELGSEAMTAVRGGQDDQAIGTSQANVQNMAATANVGNFSLFAGPTNLQSDNTFKQDAHNTSYAANSDVTSIGWCFPSFVR